MRKITFIIFGVLLGILLISGCQENSVCGPGQEAIVSCVNGSSTTGISISSTIISPTISITTTTLPITNKITTTTKETTTTTMKEGKFDAVKEYVEGDLVSFAYVKAVDPDNDKVTIKFSKPLNDKGEWQTKEGDAGDYVITISASDGKTTVEKKVLVRILQKNHPPVIDMKDVIRVNEGETVKLEPKVTDKDGDKVTIKYLGWMTSDTYKTNYNDAGEHLVTIIASDGKTDVVKKVKVIVNNVNRAPVIKVESPVKVKEGETVKITPIVSDPDNDKVTVKFESPLSPKGEWKTKIGDAGTYNLVVSASDGEKTSAASVKIIVEKANHPPIIMMNSTLTYNEGDTIVLKPKVIDKDGDKVSVKYSGWMTSDTYTTNYNDAGEHKVTITASDGKEETKKVITIIVNDVNRPPEFII